MSHTPGPWSAGHIVNDDHPCSCRYIFGNDGRMGAVASVHLDDGTNYAPPLQECAANARLIAAAPDLLAALKALLVPDGGTLLDRDRAKVAIGKATGAA